MKLKAFRLQNYKVFKDTGWIELSNLTFFLGYNSNGKSTLLKALDLVRKCYLQMQSGQELPPLVTNDEEDGSFSDCFSQGSDKEKEDIVFSFRFYNELAQTDDSTLEGILKQLEKNKNPNINFWEYSVFINEYEGETVVRKFSIKTKNIQLYTCELVKNQYYVAYAFSEKQEKYEMKALFKVYNTFFLRADSEKAKINNNRNDYQSDLSDRFARLLQYYVGFQVLEETNCNMREFAKNLEYILPIRVSPTRQMMLQTDKSMRIGLNGENVYRILYNAYFTEQTDLKDKVNHWLSYFGYSFEWNMLKPNYGEFMLTDLKTGHKMNIVDVGFGISQVLPVIVSACQNTDGYLLLDSPEAHLHSKMQSVLGDLLIEAGKKRTVMIETHSENILLRLQKRIVEGLDEVVTKDFAKIYFIHDVGMETVCEPIVMDELGQFVDCSQEFTEFFSDGFSDIMEMTMLKSKKLQEGHKDEDRN